MRKPLLLMEQLQEFQSLASEGPLQCMPCLLSAMLVQAVAKEQNAWVQTPALLLLSSRTSLDERFDLSVPYFLIKNEFILRRVMIKDIREALRAEQVPRQKYIWHTN